MVTSATIRTFPDSTVIVSSFNATIPDRDQFYSFIADFHSFLPKLSDAGGSGYYYIFSETNSIIVGALFAGQSNPNATEALFEPLIQKAHGYPNSQVDWNQLPSFPISVGIDMSLNGTDVTASNSLLSSRLISRKFLESADGPKKLCDVFKTLGPNQNTVFIGHIVGGGQVARNEGLDSAIHPSWRKALIHLVFARGWETSTPFQEQAIIARNMTDVETPILAALEPDMGAYMNEADLNERRWQEVFWGEENYDRLLSIKAKWDTEELFMCKPCVGSENWDAESICRK